MFVVIFLDTISDTVDILGMFPDSRDALRYMTETVDVDERWKDDAWIRKQYEDSNTISIYSSHWIAQKTLIARYFLKEFE